MSWPSLANTEDCEQLAPYQKKLLLRPSWTEPSCRGVGAVLNGDLTSNRSTTSYGPGGGLKQARAKKVRKRRRGKISKNKNKIPLWPSCPDPTRFRSTPMPLYPRSPTRDALLEHFSYVSSFSFFLPSVNTVLHPPFCTLTSIFHIDNPPTLAHTHLQASHMLTTIRKSKLNTLFICFLYCCCCYCCCFAFFLLFVWV